jgi:hypothetical protein
MSTEIDNEQAVEQTIETPVAEPVREQRKPDPRLDPEPVTEKSVRNLLKSSMKEAVKTADEPIPMTAKERKAVAAKSDKPVESKAPVQSQSTAKVDAPISSEVKPTVEVMPDAPQTSGIAPPAALSKEEKAFWDKTPKEMQEAFLRREKDVQKGIDNLKAKYQPIEDVLAPIKPLLQQNGLTEAHAVRQLFDWHRALASPNKAAQVSAFKALAQSHGVDLSSINPPQQQTYAQQPNAQQPNAQPQQVDPLQQIQPLLERYLQPLQERQANYEAEIQRQKFEAANNELATFSKDKPHFDQVRVRMAEILTTAAQFGRPVSLQEAYDEAVWGMPELRAGMLQEQDLKRENEYKANLALAEKKAQDELAEKQKREAELEAKRKEQEALEKARRASVSPRSTAPVGSFSSGKPTKSQSVADTLRSVIKDSRASV